MNILALSGSASPNSGNYYLLEAIAEFVKEQHELTVYQGLYEFELFTPQALKNGVPENIQALKKMLTAADAVLISTPEYTHNIPAVLKNLIEWCTASGEFCGKKTIVSTFTPHEPRGEYAMESLLASLKALDAKILTQFSLYKTDVDLQDQKLVLNAESKEMLNAAVELLEG